MDTAAFLARTIAPGNYFAVGYNRGFGTEVRGLRMFPANAYADAAGFIGWLDRKGWDAYHAQSSFTMAHPTKVNDRGQQEYGGERTFENVHQIRSFFIDFDVKREGDKKALDKVYMNRADAMTWLKGFLTTVGLPLPNQIVSSGYGLHAYWILEDPMRGDEWKPYADALKTLMNANGFRGDVGISGDAARLLRPIGSHNYKCPEAPAPVEMVPRSLRGEIPNELMLGVLRPHIAAQPVSVARAGQGTASALAGGVVSSVFAGAQAPNMAAAAQANLPTSARRERSFLRISQECEQTRLSLANGGAGDQYPLWYLGHLTTAHFCTDGADFVHKIGNQDPRYTPVATDKAVAQIAAEQSRKGLGFPSCAHYDQARPGVCQGCKHFGKVRSPLDLGLEHGDLPEGYRRMFGALQRWVKPASNRDGYWETIVEGDVYGPVLDRLPGGSHAVSFTYELAGEKFGVRACDSDMLEPAKAGQALTRSSITLSRHNVGDFGDFIVAWISKLRAQRLTRTETVLPFGWTINSDANVSGFAVAGTHYRSDGSEEPAPGGDKVLVLNHTPQGDMAKWRTAADFVLRGRPDLQVIAAASFGSPLMRLSGLPGVVLSAWSSQSGVGKSSAMLVAQAVWGSPTMLNGMRDTGNSVFHKLASLRALPIFWDEIRSDSAGKVADLVFQLASGKEKSRLESSIAMRAVGSWESILVTAANQPLADGVAAQNASTDAGVLRLIEYEICRDVARQNASAASTVALAMDHYGHAGRIYAKYIATHAPQLTKTIEDVAGRLIAATGAMQPERFCTTGMAALLVGAAIAAKLGLFDFDVTAMDTFLRNVFFQMRKDRASTSVTNGAGIDLEQVLGLYISDMMGRRIVTNKFLAPGHSTKEIELLWHPRDNQHAEIHVSQEDGIMRINRASFRDWCRTKHFPPDKVVNDMVARWKAVVGRKVIGGGTGFGGGQIMCVDLPLTAPELSHYLYAKGTSSTAPMPRSPNVR